MALTDLLAFGNAARVYIERKELMRGVVLDFFGYLNEVLDTEALTPLSWVISPWFTNARRVQLKILPPKPAINNLFDMVSPIQIGCRLCYVNNNAYSTCIVYNRETLLVGFGRMLP